MKRTIVKIDESRCNGCGLCVTGCHEGALQIIDGKARIVADIYCDGLGACIGDCPEDAITLEEREAEAYDEQAVMARTASLQEKPCGCPGAKEMSFSPSAEQKEVSVCSYLRQWPIQLHLLNPAAPFLKNTNMVLAADCTAFAYGDFHHRFMKNNSVAIACPKLDHSQEVYVEKLTAMIDRSAINTLTVIVMEVPCCGGLLQIARQAQANAKRKIPIKKVIVGIQGEIQNEEWI
ncbi:MAG: 4Fe-4S binding protein [Bacteroidales bacterium]|nr:4Fe-4S binding protein [Bacteroidales bacterium]